MCGAAAGVRYLRGDIASREPLSEDEHVSLSGHVSSANHVLSIYIATDLKGCVSFMRHVCLTRMGVAVTGSMCRVTFVALTVGGEH